MARELAQPAALNSIRQFEVFDDFFHYATTVNGWTSTASGTSAAVAHDADGVGGLITLTSGTTDNGHAYAHYNEVFQLIAKRPIEAWARLSITEADTDAAIVGFGLADGVAAGTLLDDGAGVDASYSGAMIYKLQDSPLWRCNSSVAAAQTTSISNQATDDAATEFHTLRIKFTPESPTEFNVTFWCDPLGGNNVKQLQDANGKLIIHKVTLGTSTQMALFAGVKCGTATKSEVVTVDWMYAGQERFA